MAPRPKKLRDMGCEYYYSHPVHFRPYSQQYRVGYMVNDQPIITLNGTFNTSYNRDSVYRPSNSEDSVR